MGTNLVVRADFLAQQQANARLMDGQIGRQIVQRARFNAQNRDAQLAIEQAIVRGELAAIAQGVRSGQIAVGSTVLHRHGHRFSEQILSVVTSVRDGFLLVTDVRPAKRGGTGLHALFCDVSAPPIEQKIADTAKALVA